MSGFGTNATLGMSAFPPVMRAKRTSTNAENWSVHVRSDRQAHRKYRSLARFACHSHVAAHHARELAGNGKAEARHAIAARGQRIGLGEILKQFPLLLAGHPNSAVRDGKLDPLPSVRNLAHPQRDLALFREFAGIAQQIE